MKRAYAAHLQILVESAVYRQTRVAAGPNELLSKVEQRKAPGYVQESATQLREDGGPGTRVPIPALDLHLSDRVRSVLDSVNQKKGPGRAYISKPERDLAVQDQSFGPVIAKAWAIAVGDRADVDLIAEARAQQGLEPDGRFILFGTEEAAASFMDPRGRSVKWLVKLAEDETKTSFVRGSNDLWVERFDIDAKTGQVTTTAEH